MRLIHEGLISVGIEHSLHEVSNDDLINVGKLESLASTTYNRSLFREILQSIHRHSPDLVHVENSFPKLGVPALDAIREAGVPWVRTFRNFRFNCIAGSHFRDGKICTLCPATRNPLPGIALKCYKSSFTQSIGATVQTSLTTRRANRHRPRITILTSEFLRKEYLGSIQGQPKTAVVRNPVAKLEHSGVSPSKPRPWDCCYVGRLDDTKGLTLLLSLINRRPDLSFLIAGGGSDIEKLAEISASGSRIRYLGELEPAGVEKVLEESTVTLVPSIWKEPYGRLPFEAVQHGSVPIVANTGGIPENMKLLHLEELVVPDYSVDAWSEVIDRALAQSNQQKAAMLSRAQLEILNKFSPTTIARSLVRVYEDALR